MHSAKGGWSRRIRGSSHCSRAFGNPASYNTVLQDTHARTVGWGMGDGGWGMGDALRNAGALTRTNSKVTNHI